MVLGVVFLIGLATIANIIIFKFFYGWWQSILFGHIAIIFEFAIFIIVSIIREEDDEV